ncbi:hypothetical protein ACIQMY_20940 [Streptomyces sp. NPDC091368]|uniref:hypothetical protein n=1 Tax=Streptomyces sp. NPDC091368 TaxID=3365993 RepID=UPI0038222C6D
MTGPEHYEKAEHLLRYAASTESDRARDAVQEAQVHATLALAAATALSDPTRSAARAPLPEWNAWKQAAGVAAQEDKH